MASLNMFSKEQHRVPITSLSPRISFSNDFAETIQKCCYREAPVSSDFEFSVTNYSMMPADELFSKGKLLPSKKTLRDELLADDEHDDVFFRPPKSSARRLSWLGLRSAQNMINKVHDIAQEKNGVEGEGPVLVPERMQTSQTIQELLREGD